MQNIDFDVRKSRGKEMRASFYKCVVAASFLPRVKSLAQLGFKGRPQVTVHQAFHRSQGTTPHPHKALRPHHQRQSCHGGHCRVEEKKDRVG